MLLHAEFHEPLSGVFSGGVFPFLQEEGAQLNPFLLLSANRTMQLQKDSAIGTACVPPDSTQGVPSRQHPILQHPWNDWPLRPVQLRLQKPP